MPFSQSGLRLIGSHLLVGIAREKMAQRTESIQKQKAQVGMSPASYIKQLEAVDFRNFDSIITFVYETQTYGWGPYPKPIILGSENGLVYQLRSELLDLEPSDDLPASATTNDALTEIRSTNPTIKCPLQLVLPLGILEYSIFDGSSRTETPFRVCLNPVDRSIWLVFTPDRLDDLGDRVSTPRVTDPWPCLGLNSDGRMQFDVMELMTWKEFQSLEDQSQALKRDIFGLAKVA